MIHLSSKTLLQSLLIGGSILLTGTWFSACQPKTKPSTTLHMESFNNHYDADWKKVDSLEQQGLPKSALEQVLQIKERALRENQSDHWIKALIYQGKYTMELEEDGTEKAILLIEKEGKMATQPAKSILQSLLGEWYQQYLMDNQWQLSNRTPIPAGEGGDVKTWSTATLAQKSTEYFEQSIQEADLLEGVPLQNWELLIKKGALDSIQQQALRSNLYELLVHRALNHYQDSRSFLPEPAYRFDLNQEAAFAPAETFQSTVFETRDSQSGTWNALRLYQQLTRKKWKEGVGPKILDLELSRLQFALGQSNRSDRSVLYRIALERLIDQYGAFENSTEAIYALATQLVNELPENKIMAAKQLQAAVQWCEKALEKFPNAYGSTYCRVLLNSIREPQLKVKMEVNNLPNEALLLSFDYKNIQKAWYKIVRLPEGYEEVSFEDAISYYLGLPEVAKGSEALAEPGDLLSHRTEIGLNGLPSGNYVLLVGHQNSLQSKTDVSDFALFNACQIGAIRLFGNAANTTFLTVDRKTGAPIEGVQGTLMQTDWVRDRYQRRVIGNYVSDSNGKIELKKELPHNSFLVLKKGQDVFTTEHIYPYGTYRERNSGSIAFFTDRGLYRPGQLLYFKGIALEKSSGKTPTVLKNQNVQVQLMDANYQQVATLQLKTNAFGTFNGAFTLPLGQLTGAYTLQAKAGIAEGQSRIQVEEYKRPRFEVSLAPLAGAYKIGSSVQVNGKALNYSGNPSDGSKVVWRVVRKSHYPWWWARWRPAPKADQQEIASGTGITDEQGHFQLTFTALPSSQPADQQPPAFYYEINVDITDNTGETRSALSSVAIGKNSLFLGSSLPEEVEPTQMKAVKLLAENLSGQALPTKGTLTIQYLNAPERLFRRRLFEQPDRWSMTEQAFRTKFPSYSWKNEEDPSSWKPVGSPINLPFDTGLEQPLDLSSRLTETGYYRVTMTAQDAFGSEVKHEQFVRVKKAAADVIAPTVAAQETRLEPGQVAQLIMGSSASNWHVYLFTERPNRTPEQGWTKVRTSSSLELAVTENDRGNMYTSWICLYDNRVYEGKITWEIPWTNKQLQLSLESFRDKLQPGAQERYQLRVSGPGKEKVAAEITASMYDASLDQFLPFQWSFFPHSTFPSRQFMHEEAGARVDGHQYIYVESKEPSLPNRSYPQLNWFGLLDQMGSRRFLPMAKMAGAPGVRMRNSPEAPQAVAAEASMELALDGSSLPADELEQKKVNLPSGQAPAPLRRNLQETVFFFPDLKTDANGDVLIAFTMSEALSRWKLQVLAHTQDLQVGLMEKTLVTQKELMITANPPRFLRAGDELEMTAKVSNLTDHATEGTATLTLLDANSLQPIETQLGLLQPVQSFRLEAGLSTGVRWKINVPVDYTGAVTWQVFAQSKAGRDGEENTLPVVTNRMLVTESLPMTLRGQQNKAFQFGDLNRSDSRQNHQFTLEFSSNPAWYAVQALPYLMEYPHECSEQIFNRFYANTLAAAVTQKLPGIRRVFDQWKGTKALESNLSKNQELKYALLEETPWVLEAQSEAQQKQQIGLLFDLNNLSNAQAASIRELKQRQSEQGGWPWFAGGPDNWYITQYIATGLAHLYKLNALDSNKNKKADEMLEKAVRYCDQQAQEQYRQLEKEVKAGRTKWEDDHLHGMIIHYLYLKSFFPTKENDPVLLYYRNLIGKYWTSKNLYEQGLLALTAHRTGDPTSAASILRSLRERALIKEEMGMFWPNEWGMRWNQLPIETQALMVEVFNEAAQDTRAVEELRIWMLKNKQTNRWESTKATAEAVYALLLTGDNWLSNTRPVSIQIGNQVVRPKEVEAGTGYFKETWTGKESPNPSASIQVQNPNGHMVWGAAYRQYFEDLDKITTFKTNGIQLVREVYKSVHTDRGPVLQRIADQGKIKVGDQLVVRVEIRADRDMEYVHLKDLRPAGCEPKNVLSGYRYQGGLGYYESTRDLATHYFMDYLPKGTYVLEYPIVATHKGEMSFGLATLQCMYAPEFSSHSAGIRIKIE